MRKIWAAVLSLLLVLSPPSNADIFSKKLKVRTDDLITEIIGVDTISLGSNFDLTDSGNGIALIDLDTDTLREVLAHADATDMPDTGGTVPDHDVRYYTKDEIHDLVAGANFSFHLSDTADGSIGGYNVMFDMDTGESESSVTAAGVSADDTLIQPWITEASQPTFTVLSEGTYPFHFHGNVNTTGAAWKTIKVYFELYKRAAGGAETLLMTSEESDVLTDTGVSYEIHATLFDEEVLLTDDRLVIKVYANVENETPPNDPNVTIFMEGTTHTRIEVKTTIAAFDDRYIQSTGVSTTSSSIPFAQGLSSDGLVTITTFTTPGAVINDSSGNLSGGGELDDLADVDTTGVDAADFLQWSGSSWLDFDLFNSANTFSRQQSFEGSGDTILVAEKMTHDGNLTTFVQFLSNLMNLEAGGSHFVGMGIDGLVPTFGINIDSASLDTKIRTQSDNFGFFVDASAAEVSTGASTTFNIKGEAAGQTMFLTFGFHTTNAAVNLALRPQSSALMGDSNTRGWPTRKAGSVIGITVVYDLNSNTGSADVVFEARRNAGSSWVDLLTVTDTTPSAADGIRLDAEASRGTHAFLAGDIIGVNRAGDGTLETDDMLVVLEIQLDT